jgi:2,4-dienoyl-CoA reductase-like NADH-dependent reductase (Old Yellow Enzyme family)
MDGSVIAAPLRIGSLELPGRVFKAASAESRASVDGYVTDELLEFYEPMAIAGTPLIVTGNLFVSTSNGPWTHRQCGIDADDKIEGLRRLVDMVHRHGSRVFAQLSHSGRQVAGVPVEPVGASAVRDKITAVKPRAMTVAEIRQVVDDYAAGTWRAKEAGFDGVQYHMAHGYLINQFLSPYTNRRRDEYGGSPEARMRFVLDILRETRERVGADFPLSAKLNGHDYLYGRRGGLRTAHWVEIARRLEAAGVDALEISAGHYESGGVMMRGRWNEFFRGSREGQALLPLMMAPNRPPTPSSKPRIGALHKAALRVYGAVGIPASNVLWGYREGFNAPLARHFKEAVSIPVACVGGWQHRDAIERAIEGGDCDAVALARGMIADPLIYRHLLESGSGTPECVYCNACVGRAGGMPTDCYNPGVRAERDAVMRAEIGWHPTVDLPVAEKASAAAHAA